METRFCYLLSVLTILVCINQAVAQDTVCAAGATLAGVDVSHDNGSITWSSVKAAGIVFAYAEATDGTAFTDPQFSVNWPGMKAAGIVRGAYDYFEPNIDATAQANYFVNAMGTLQPDDLPPMLDLEVTDGQSATTMVAKVAAWLSYVQAATGRVPIIYTSEGFWNNSVSSTNFSGYPLWIAKPGVTCPTLAESWTNWAIWQNSLSATVSGITGTVDTDEFNGSMSNLLAFANPPRLNIARDGTNKVALTWSTFAIGFGLQQNQNLNTTNWLNVTNTPSVISNQEQVVLGTSTNHVFLRLFHP